MLVTFHYALTTLPKKQERGKCRPSVCSDTMKIDISERAQKWFEQELGVGKGLGVRFLGKVYGKTEVHEGFSLGIEVTEPQDPIAEATYNGIVYFAEKQDEWFFHDYNLQVEFDEERDEPTYHFIEQ